MTDRARWLLLIAFVGLVAGIVRGQVHLAWLSLSIALWVLVEWFRFQWRIRLQLPRLQFVRRVNGRSESTGSLWAGRKVPIEIQMQIGSKRPPAMSILPLRWPWMRRAANVWHDGVQSLSTISPIIHVRDVVPEIFEAIPSTDTLIVQERVGRQDGDAATDSYVLRLLLRIQSWIALAVKPKSISVCANEWTHDTSCGENLFKYMAVLRAAGNATLPGVRLTLEDRFALFRAHRFVELRQDFRILPDFYQSGELRPTVKRNNSLPKHGIHRVQREGVGAELLELREYEPGDPPKSIAWKVSARRNKLMTRKYESEVPVRVHLFVDGSVTTRSGGYGYRLIDQMNYVAASVAKAATVVGDPIGGMLVDQNGVQHLRWMSGDRGFMQLLRSLSDFTHASPAAATEVSPYMMRCAMKVCHERYPELLDRQYNRIPFSFRGATRDRYRVVGVLAQLHGLPAREQVECFYDDAKLAVHLQKFLFEAGFPWMAPLFSANVDPAVAGARSMRLLSEAMSKAIAHAQDNEVFVVLADPLSCAPNFIHLQRVVKLALAKHHRVAFICPTSTFARPSVGVIRPESPNITDLLVAAERVRVRDVALHLKRELVRLGVAVTFSGEQSAIRLVLAEMELARDGRSQRRGVRA
jgi:uncharacterized protein (DUF58 family)